MLCTAAYAWHVNHAKQESLSSAAAVLHIKQGSVLALRRKASMNVSDINKKFAKIGAWQLKHRWQILACTLVVTVFGCLGLPRLELSANEEDWFDDADQISLDTDRFEENFGSDDSFMVLVRADDVFAPEVLSAIDRLSNRLEQEAPYANKVTSLTHLSVPKADEEGFEVINPFEDGIPDDPEELQRKKEFILSRESLLNNIVSDDCKETWVILSFEPYEGGLAFAEKAISPYLRNIVLADEFQGKSYKFLPTGMSYTEMEEGEVCAQEIAIRVGIGFAVMLLCLIIFVRSLRGVIVPSIATIGGIGTTLGINAWLGIVGQDSMVALPILLGMALSVGYSIHYINSFRMHFRVTGNRKESVVNAVEETGWPILFTVITTIASLISFLFAGILPIRWVGGISAAIVFAVYLYVIIFIPILMSFGKDRAPDKEAARVKGATKTDRGFEKLGDFVCRRAAPVAACASLIMLAQLPGMFRMEVNMDYTKMMGLKIPYVARLIDMLSGKLGSLYSFNLLVEFDEADALKEPQNMKCIEQMEDELGRLRLVKHSGSKPRVTSVTQMIKEMNRTLNSDDDACYAIPDDKDMLTQLMFLYEISGDDIFDWIDEDYKTTYIHIELSGYDANAIVADLNDVKLAAARIFPGVRTSVVGEVVNYAEMNGKLVNGLLKSFFGSFVIIAALMIFAFGSIGTGLIGMIPNIAPVMLIGGVMGYFRMPLDMITMIVMPMILGIAVDDTIHMTNHVKYGLEKTGNYREAIMLSFREIGKSMGMTTFILCAMFVVFIFSPMGALKNVGLLSVVGLGAALLADYTLTPALIFITKPFGSEEKIRARNQQK